MKQALALLTVLFSSSAAWAGGSDLRIVYDFEFRAGDKPLTVESRYFLRKGAGRIETELPGTLVDNVVFLRQPEQNRTVILTPGQKTYAVLSNSTESKSKTSGPRFKKTGTTKRVAGHKCEVFTRKKKSVRETACFNRKLLKKSELEGLKAVDRQRRSPFLPTGITAFPLEYTYQEVSASGKKGVKNVVRMREIHRERLKITLFEIPKDYSRAQLGTLNSNQLDAISQIKNPRLPEVPQDEQKRVDSLKNFVRETNK